MNDEILIKSLLDTSRDDDHLQNNGVLLSDHAVGLLCNHLLQYENDDENNKALHSSIKRRLILRGCYITAASSNSISNLLRNTLYLEYLSLEWNHLGSDGAAIIAQSLDFNKSLTYLDLRNNSITNEGAIALANCLEFNSTLLTLDLRWNKIEDKGLLSFKKSITERNPSINLVITGNLISDSSLHEFHEWQSFVSNTPVVSSEESKIVSSEIDPNTIRNEMLNKEIIALRQQCAGLQSIYADLQRQLDTSSLLVTELEQELAKEKFMNERMKENLNQSNHRCSIQNDQIQSLTSAWNNERSLLKDEISLKLGEKDNEIHRLKLDKDLLHERLTTSHEENKKLIDQLEQLRSQLEADRTVMHQQLRQTLNDLNQLTLTENQLKAKNSSIRSLNDRLEDRIKVLQDEAIMNLRENENVLLTETERLNSAIIGLKDDHAVIVQKLSNKIMKQENEIIRLEDLLNETESKNSNMILELETNYDNNMKESKEIEKKKYESTIAEFKQRLELVSSARNEAEKRCNDYLNEISKINASHIATNNEIQSQLHQLQFEVDRQQSENDNKQSLVNSLTKQSTLQLKELDDLRKRLRIVEGESIQWNQELQMKVALNAQLQSKIDEFEQELLLMNQNRSKEFDEISSKVLKNLENQFEKLKLEMRILNTE
eukprot:gene8306-11237_t